MNSVTNVTPEPTHSKQEEKGGDSGDTLTPADIVKKVDHKVPSGVSQRYAIRQIAAVVESLRNHRNK